MSLSLFLTFLCVAGVFPHVSGSATLVPRLSSAGCTGHLKDLSVTSITCEYSNEGCTYGSEVFITGQVTADSDLPRPMKLSVSKTFPSVYNVGPKVYNIQINDICESGTLISFPDDDSEDICPGAGVYNFNFKYENFGTRESWYAGWSGYSFGMSLHVKYEGGGSDYGTCHINVHASHGEDDSYATDATFVSIATLGLAGVCIGLFNRRRKERLASTIQNENKGRTKELSTNFELVEDSSSSFV